MKDTANAFLQIISRLEVDGVDLTALKALLVIAKFEGRGVLETAKKGEIHKSVFSRSAIVLAGGKPNIIPPQKALISMQSAERNIKLLFLTERGKKLIEDLGEFLPSDSQ